MAQRSSVSSHTLAEQRRLPPAVPQKCLSSEAQMRSSQPLAVVTTCELAGGGGLLGELHTAVNLTTHTRDIWCFNRKPRLSPPARLHIHPAGSLLLPGASGVAVASPAVPVGAAARGAVAGAAGCKRSAWEWGLQCGSLPGRVQHALHLGPPTSLK